MPKLSYDKLTESQIADYLALRTNWTIDHGALRRSVEFDSYSTGVAFAGAVAYLADRLNHHPDILIGYKNVKVSLVTHDAGGGLTAYDFELARQIDERLLTN